MSAAGGFPDWQRITQWFGNSLSEEAGHVLNAGQLVVGPLNVRSFASIVVWIKAIGGNVTVTVTQQVPDGPASLQTQSSFVVAAGNVLAEAFVLLAGEATVTFQGAAAGTSMDYAIVPANTNVNAEVAALTQLGFQHNDLVVATETAIDLEDAPGFVWTMLDDPANLRMKVTPPSLDCVKLADVLLGGPAASIDISGIPATYDHLLLEIVARSDQVATQPVTMRCNADAGANYDAETILQVGVGASIALESIGAASGRIGRAPGAGAPGGWYSSIVVELLDYTQLIAHSATCHVGSAEGTGTGNIALEVGHFHYRVGVAINELTVFTGGNFVAGSRATLLGLR